MPGQPLNFFVVLRTDSGEEIKLLRTNQDVQDQLSAIFLDGIGALSSQDLERVPFSQSYRIDDSEIFSIGDHQVGPEVEVAVRDPASVDSLVIASGSMPAIKSIFTGWIDDGGQLNVAFQLFKKNQYLTRSGLSLILSGNTFNALADPGIIVTYDVTAFHAGGELLFRSYFHARQLFDLSDHYRDATQADIDGFVGHEKIQVDDPDAFEQNADQWVRRKLAIIQDRGLLDEVEVSDIVTRAKDFGIDVVIAVVDGENCISLPDGKQELKGLLRFLDEDYFEGPISAAKFLSNSKRKAE